MKDVRTQSCRIAGFPLPRSGILPQSGMIEEAGANLVLSDSSCRHLLTRSFPPSPPSSGTTMGRGAVKWDGLKCAQIGARSENATADPVGNPSKRVPNRRFCVPLSLRLVPDPSRIFIDIPNISLKWDKWDSEFGEG
jgi:hypothetical protein